MPEHIYEKGDLIQRFDGILNKTFGEIDNIEMFGHVQEFQLQKGVAGAIIEQCVLCYSPDTKQEPDLVVVEPNGKRIKTELKTTGMRLRGTATRRFVAKEPMSITAVGIYDLADQVFDKSHFWEKLEHMLIVYYLYDSARAVPPYEYRLFPVKGYEFHEFSQEDKKILASDWQYVHSLVASIVSNHPGPRNANWRIAVKDEYIARHSLLRRNLSFIDLAPKFPPRFRLKKPTVDVIISNHFGYALEQLPGRYADINSVDKKCHELVHKYSGKTIREIALLLGLPIDTREKLKSISEKIVIAMFGGTESKINKIKLFAQFGLIAKTVTVTSTGKRTEDMKLLKADFEEMLQSEIYEDGERRNFEFEDSELYNFFADHELLCILFKEPTSKAGERASLFDNKFIGFKRIVFSDEFIDNDVRRLWNDTREKIKGGTLVDVVQRTKSGEAKRNKNGEISSAPNFLKSDENTVFFRGSGIDSSRVHKTECVNGVHMLPQYIWIKGISIIDQLNDTPEV